MKIFIPLFLIAYFSSSSFSQESLENVIVEQIDASSVMENGITYRVFIDLAPGWEFNNIYAEQDCPLIFNTSETWYNSEYGGISSGTINSELIDIFPETAFDSYLSFGGATSSEWAVLYTDDTDGTIDGKMEFDGNDVPMLSTLGVSINESTYDNFGTTPTQDTFIEYDGHLFTLTSNGDTTPHNRIMVGQFTTSGDFGFSLNLHTKMIGTNNVEALFACEIPSLNFPVNVGIENISIDANSLTIYPNPAQNELFTNFQLIESTLVRFDIFDISGKAVISEVCNLTVGEVTHMLDTKSLEAGLYVLRISHDNSLITRKFTILR